MKRRPNISIYIVLNNILVCQPSAVKQHKVWCMSANKGYSLEIIMVLIMIT